MISYPNAKINLGLHVVERRTDGFHSIETVFFPLKTICDILEIIPGGKQTSISSTGLELDATPQENICIKAWQMLHDSYAIPPVEIHLHKQIPFGAGLGGGSSDATHALVQINELFRLKLDSSTLRSFALRLGSDCAFFIENRPMLASGRGELFESIENLSLQNCYIALVKPAVGVNTTKAYAGITPKKPETDLRNILSQPIEKWGGRLVNDFEKSVFIQYPEIARIKKQLYNIGATYASMSGSGSAVYGIFRQQPYGLQQHFPDCFCAVEHVE